MGKLKAGEMLPKSFINNLNFIGNQIFYNSAVATGMFNKTKGEDSNPKYGDRTYEYQPFYTNRVAASSEIHNLTRIYISKSNTFIDNDFSVLAEDGVTVTMLSSDTNSWSVVTINDGTLYFFRETLRFTLDTRNKTLMTARYSYKDPSVSNLTDYSNFLLCYNTDSDRDRVATNISSTDFISMDALNNAHHYVSSYKSAIVDVAKSRYYYKTIDRVLKFMDLDLGETDWWGNKKYTLMKSASGHYINIEAFEYIYDSDTNISFLYLSKDSWLTLIEDDYPYGGIVYLNNLDGLQNFTVTDTAVQTYLAVLLIKTPNLDDMDRRDARKYVTANPKDVLNTRDVNIVETFNKNNIVKYKPKYFKGKLRQFYYGTTEEVLFDKYQLTQFCQPNDIPIDFFEGDSAYGKALPCAQLDFSIAKLTTSWLYIKV